MNIITITLLLISGISLGLFITVISRYILMETKTLEDKLSKLKEKI